MKHEIPSPITDESFSTIWDYTNGKLIELKKKKLIRTILVLVANIIFFLCATTLLLSLLARIPSSTITSFLDTLGPLKTLVTITNPIICHPNLHVAVQIIIYLAFLFIPAFLVSGIITLIVCFTYHPVKPNTETGDKAVDSKTLIDAIFEIQVRGKKVDGISSLTSTALFVIALLALTVYLVIFITSNPEQLANDAAITLLMQFLAANPVLATVIINGTQAAPVLFMIVYGIYAALNEVLSNLLKPFYKTNLAASLQKDAKDYYYECNPVIKEAYEEEERILERAIEIKLKRRQEEADLMAKINYKNPVYKYIKIGVVTLILIAMIVFAGSKIKSLDIEKFLNDLGIESVEGNTESSETEMGTEVNNE